MIQVDVKNTDKIYMYIAVSALKILCGLCS